MSYKRYFFHCAYLGINYRGWQTQPDVVSVQETIEQTFSMLFKKKITIMGCGRTDAKVHASQYFFHVDLKESIDFDFLFVINKMLPKDISIYDIIEVEMNNHARFDAVTRTYDYFLHVEKNPFWENSSALYQENFVAFDEMQKAVLILKKYENFEAFCKSPLKHNSTYCKIFDAKIEQDKTDGKIHFQITANRFLRGMIRLIMGKLIDVGKGEFSVEEFENCLKTNEPPKLIMPAHPQGLYLTEIKYPFLDIQARKEFLPFNLFL